MPTTHFHDQQLHLNEAEEQADRNAADLLSQLDEEEAASKSKAFHKPIKNRAAKLRKKKKSVYMTKCVQCFGQILVESTIVLKEIHCR